MRLLRLAALIPALCLPLACDDGGGGDSDGGTDTGTDTGACEDVPVADCASAPGHSLYYTDGDGDGFGDPATAICLCAPDATHTATNGDDCDDADAEINPDAAELADGIDNNCDDQTDEGYYYVDWDGSVLGIGDACGTGACEGGTVVANADGTALECSTSGNATAEACDAVDNDCDGYVDEDLTDVADSTCATTGVCGAAGAVVVATCVAGTWQCDYSGVPGYNGAAELACDGLDNNCDGEADEGFVDGDTDGVADCVDNCVEDANADQADGDSDGVGTVCDGCPDVANADQSDGDQGEPVEFTHDNYSSEYDYLEPGVRLWRDSAHPIRNIDGGEVEWGCMACAESTVFYSSLKNCFAGNMSAMAGRTTCLHVIATDSYYEMAWSWWQSSSSGGGFTYTRVAISSPDGIPDVCDNCPGLTNEDQLDLDGDEVGDACDNCPDAGNPDQANWDTDSAGDACENSDTDTLMDDDDNCPGVGNSGQQDTDSDSVGDACDNCPDDANADQANSDAFAVKFTHLNYSLEEDCIEPDVCIWRDVCSMLVNRGPGTVEWACGPCSDGNTLEESQSMYTIRQECSWGGNSAITGQTVCLHILESNTYWDLNFEWWQGSCSGGGFRYVRTTADDGFGDVCDNCPDVSNEDQADGDTDGLGDVCDNCPDDANASQLDGDSDGAGNACDSCPADPYDDGDGDGVCGNLDNCPAVSNNSQQDTDSDDVGDACDNCPDDANATQYESDRVTASFTHDSYSADEDCIETDVCLWRDWDDDALVNTGTDTVQWACGKCDPSATFTANMADLEGGCSFWDNLEEIVGQDVCVHIIDSDAYWSLHVTGWQDSRTGGGFAYTRTRGDFHGDPCDNCPSVLNADQADADSDGVGNACE